MNDFGFPLQKPNHPRYLNTEFVGHTYPTKTIDQVERLTEHTMRHARIHDQLASDPQYAGGIGWCAFDYNTHGDFGSGDRICYHGVTDIFREQLRREIADLIRMREEHQLRTDLPDQRFERGGVTVGRVVLE